MLHPAGPIYPETLARGPSAGLGSRTLLRGWMYILPRVSLKDFSGAAESNPMVHIFVDAYRLTMMWEPHAATWAELLRSDGWAG